jgi:hypothetical protein
MCQAVCPIEEPSELINRAGEYQSSKAENKTHRSVRSRAWVRTLGTHRFQRAGFAIRLIRVELNRCAVGHQEFLTHFDQPGESVNKSNTHI